MALDLSVQMSRSVPLLALRNKPAEHPPLHEVSAVLPGALQLPTGVSPGSQMSVHGMQANAPSLLLYLPGVQTVHDLLSLAEKCPAGQAVQDVAAFRANLPIGHLPPEPQ